MGFSFVRIIAVLQLSENVPDPYLLFGLRTGWQNAFRQAIRCGRHCCAACITPDCPGFLAFSQSLTPDPAALRRFQKPSPPYIFDIPLLPEMPNKHAVVTVCLTLVGNAVHHRATYLAALRLFLDNPLLPVNVVGFQTGGYGCQRYSLHPANGADNMIILSDEGVVQSRALSPSEICIEFTTPLRLQREGKPVRILAPSLVLRSLLRRVSSLAYYYGGLELDADFKWLALQSESILAKDCSLTWINWGRNISGLLGSMTLVGNLSDFHYFLAMGEFCHIGKGSAFGLGNFILHDTTEGEPLLAHQ